MKKIFIAISLSIISLSSMSQKIIPLYAGQPPHALPCNCKESIIYDNNIRITSFVTQPTLGIYLPAVSDASKAAVLICPGGGYQILADSHEGDDVAKVFNSYGIAAFVLKYRLPNDSCMTHKDIVPLQDAQQALLMIRTHAKEWNINTDKVGIIGFSAGGHLAASVSVHFNDDYTQNPKHISLRPSFSLLIYPVISFTDSLTHMGSRDNLIGKSPSADRIHYYSNEQQVTAQTPPAFLVHATNDDVVKVDNSIVYFKALEDYHIPAEMHIYEKGGHGFGLHNPTTKEDWMQTAIHWLISQQLITGNIVPTNN